MALDDVINIDYCKKMTGFTKLFSGLIHSTVWREEMHVKVVWITMLALTDRNGFVAASLPGLADASRVSLEQCQDALARLAAPDEYSRTKLFEGRRVETADGGWRVLNYLKYRELASKDERRIAVRQAVIKHRKSNQLKSDVISGNQSNHKQKQKQNAEAEETTASPPTTRGAWLSPFLGVYGKHVGTTKPGRLAQAVRPAFESLGADKSLALFTRWCQSDKNQFGPSWFMEHWKAGLGGKRDGQQAQNLAAIESAVGPLHGE